MQLKVKETLQPVSRENLGVLPQQLPPPLLPPLSNIRGACLGKYWGWDYEKIGNGVTSMILNDEYFAIFYKHFLGLKSIMT